MFLVIRGHSERNDFENVQTSCHGKNFCSMGRIVEITVWSCFWIGMSDPRGIPAYDVEISSRVHPCFGVPLHLKLNRTGFPFIFSSFLVKFYAIFTSIGPAYNIGLGKIASNVELLSKIPSSRIALC